MLTAGALTLSSLSTLAQPVSGLALVETGSHAVTPAPQRVEERLLVPLPLVKGLVVLVPLPRPSPSPAVSMEEHARYEVAYGAFGGLGEVRLALIPEAGQPGLVRAEGSAGGSLLGLGRVERRIDTEIDPATGVPRRWKAERLTRGRRVVSTGDQPARGQVDVTRGEPGKQPGRGLLAVDGPVFDPVAMLLRLRIAPPGPGGSCVLYVLDTANLWRVTVEGLGPMALPDAAAGARPALKLAGRAEPVLWDRRPDPKRSARTFELWLSDDPFRTPLRLSVPVGLGDVVAVLVESSRR